MINIRETYEATDRNSGLIVAVVDMQTTLDTRSGSVARRLTITPAHERGDLVVSGDFDLQLIGQVKGGAGYHRRKSEARERRRQFRAISATTANDDKGGRSQ